MRSHALLLLTLAACGRDYAAGDDFNFSDEGWELETSFPGPTMSLVKSDNGGLAPYICGADTGFSGGARWQFRAPQKYTGNMGSAFRQRLTWQAMTTFQSGRLYAENDLVMVGRGSTLITEVPDTPRTSRQWAQFSVFLDSRTPWRVQERPGFPLATDDEIQAVLRTLTSLKLPGEWRDGAETSCIDAVYLGTP
jgi:hypothetical protein